MNTPEGSPAPGRTAAFAVQAVQQYAEHIRSYLARRLRKSHDVDDLTQQVYLRLIRMRISPNDIKEPVAFVRGVAQKVLSSYWRAQYREAQQFPSGGEATEVCADLPTVQLSDNPESTVDLQQQLLEQLKELPPMHAACMIAFYREGLTQKEVAYRLKLRPETVKTYLDDAKALLRKRLVAEGNPR